MKALLTRVAVLAGVLSTGWATVTHATVIQVLHINDLHSHMEPNAAGVGGYAAVGTLLSQLKASAKAEGVETLTLNGGDFLEGSPLFLAGKGEESWRFMNTLGFDAVTIGNHDWVTGTKNLVKLAQAFPPHFDFLGANFSCNGSMQILDDLIRPYVIRQIGGLRVALLGLTVRNPAHSWRAENCEIVDPLKSAEFFVPDLRKQADVVIALTHIGVKNDAKLVRKVPGIDVVVGGHSHHLLPAPRYEKDPEGRKVPIVQAGSQGEAIGQMLLDVRPGRNIEIISYRMIPISEVTAPDPSMIQLVEQVRRRLEAEYGSAWLHEVIGFSTTPLKRQRGWEKTKWSELVVDAYKHAVDTEIALDYGDFSDKKEVPAGPITREQMISLYPRIFDLEDGHGWRVWKAKVNGEVLSLVARYAFEKNLPLMIGSTEVKTRMRKGKPHFRYLLINGKRVNPLRWYSVAVPEAIARGSREITPFFKLALQKVRPTSIPVWTAIDNEIRRRSPL